jgi:prolyl-tRNA synthetase
MMQDGKALQAGTSHYLGQNFSRASEIRFLNQNGDLEYGYTTSWGVSTRLIGALIMAHSDDDGLRLPPRVAPKQIALLPVIPKDEHREEVIRFLREVEENLKKVEVFGEPLRVYLDERDIRGGEKNWQTIKKGVPLRIEAGPRDIEKNSVVLFRRDMGHKDKILVEKNSVAETCAKLIEEIQQSYFNSAKTFREEHSVRLESYPELERYFSTKKVPGFVTAPCSCTEEAEKKLAENKLSIRCIPLGQEGFKPKPCIVTGESAQQEVVIARAY